MKTVAEEWKSYKEEVLPPDVGPTQLNETQKSFYAGAKSMLSMLSLWLAGEAKSNLYPVRLERELNAFAKSIDGLD